MDIGITMDYKKMWEEKRNDSVVIYHPIVGYQYGFMEMHGQGYDPALKTEASALLGLLGCNPDDFDDEKSILAIMTSIKSALCVIKKGRQISQKMPRS